MGSVCMPPLNVTLACEVAAKLYQSFFLNDAYAWLVVLEVHFTRLLVEDRGQTSQVECPVKIQRLVRDDAQSPLDGGFTIECDGKWVRYWRCTISSEAGLLRS